MVQRSGPQWPWHQLKVNLTSVATLAESLSDMGASRAKLGILTDNRR
jgi:hypothetical protein